MKIVMASLDDAGKTTNLQRMTLDTAVRAIPAIGFEGESAEHKPGAHWDTGGHKADDEIAYSRPDDKLRKSLSPKASRKGKSIRDCGEPIAIYGSDGRDPREQRGME